MCNATSLIFIKAKKCNDVYYCANDFLLLFNLHILAILSNKQKLFLLI